MKIIFGTVKIKWKVTVVKKNVLIFILLLAAVFYVELDCHLPMNVELSIDYI